MSPWGGETVPGDEDPPNTLHCPSLPSVSPSPLLTALLRGFGREPHRSGADDFPPAPERLSPPEHHVQLLPVRRLA